LNLVSTRAAKFNIVIILDIFRWMEYASAKTSATERDAAWETAIAKR